MRSERPRGDAGTVTAELATCLPVLVLLLGVVLSAVAVAGARVRVQDAAREAARAAARGDDAMARHLAQQYAPGARLILATSGAEVTARVRVRAHVLVDWLPSLTVTASAVAALEPGSASESASESAPAPGPTVPP